MPPRSQAFRSSERPRWAVAWRSRPEPGHSRGTSCTNRHRHPEPGQWLRYRNSGGHGPCAFPHPSARSLRGSGSAEPLILGQSALQVRVEELRPAIAPIELPQACTFPGFQVRAHFRARRSTGRCAVSGRTGIGIGIGIDGHRRAQHQNNRRQRGSVRGVHGITRSQRKF
jgi:hypothetical protein